MFKVPTLKYIAYSDLMQASPTLDLVNDCFQFVTAFFEVISTSAPHIYHSAMPLSPRTSIVWKLYKPYANPLVRFVHGVPISWDLNHLLTLCYWVCTNWTSLVGTFRQVVSLVDISIDEDIGNLISMTYSECGTIVGVFYSKRVMPHHQYIQHPY
jgi:hypothetical protein